MMLQKSLPVKRFWTRIPALLLVLGLLLTACAGGGSQSKQPEPAPPAPAEQQPAQTEPTEPAKPEPPKLRIAMILPGVIEDADYNFVGYRALLALKEEYGVDIVYQERVAPADSERVARGFINDNYNVVAFHGGQFVTTVQKLAPAFPDVTFIIESAGEIPGFTENVWNIGRKFYEGFYPLGYLAGQATKTNKIGVIVGIRLPDFVASINAIQWAVASANPDAEVVYQFVGDQNNPVAARQAAEAQINAGVDFMIMIVNLGAFGVIEAVKDKPVLLTTFYTDKTDLAPQNFTTSLILDFRVPYKNVVGKILQGQRGGYEEMRPGNGMSLSQIRNVSEEAAAKTAGVFDQVAKRELTFEEKIDAIIGE